MTIATAHPNVEQRIQRVKVKSLTWVIAVQGALDEGLALFAGTFDLKGHIWANWVDLYKWQLGQGPDGVECPLT